MTKTATAHAPLTDAAVADLKRKYRRFDTVNEIPPAVARELLADMRQIFPDWEYHREFAKSATVALAPKPTPNPDPK